MRGALLRFDRHEAETPACAHAARSGRRKSRPKDPQHRRRSPMSKSWPGASQMAASSYPAARTLACPRRSMFSTLRRRGRAQRQYCKIKKDFSGQVFVSLGDQTSEKNMWTDWMAHSTTGSVPAYSCITPRGGCWSFLAVVRIYLGARGCRSIYRHVAVLLYEKESSDEDELARTVPMSASGSATTGKHYGQTWIEGSLDRETCFCVGRGALSRSSSISGQRG